MFTTSLDQYYVQLKKVQVKNFQSLNDVLHFYVPHSLIPALCRLIAELADM